MLDSMRKRKRSLFIVLAFAAIVVVFIFWGVGPQGGGTKQATFIADVNGVKIPFLDYERAYKRQIDYYKNMMKDSFTQELAEKLELKKKTLDTLIERELLLQSARSMKIKVPDKEVQDEIAASAYFKKDGVFDKDLYFSLLQRNHIKPAEYEEGVKEGLVLDRVREEILKTAVVTDAEVEAAYRKESREVSLDYIEVSAQDFMNDADVTDDEIKKYLKDNEARFMSPALMNVFYARLDKDALAASVKISEADAKAVYEKNIESYRTPVEFRARHILIMADKTASDAEKLAAKAEAEKLLQRVRKGEDFAALAKQYSKDPGSAPKGGDLGFFKLGTMVRPFENAVVALKKGEVSPVVETDFGFHIIKLEGIKKEGLTPFSEVRKKIEHDLAVEKTADDGAARMEALYGIFRTKADDKKLVEEAARRGAVAAMSGYFSERDATSPFARDRKAVEIVSKLQKGSVSDIIEGKTAWYIVRMEDIKAARPATVDEAGDRIRGVLKQEKAMAMAAAKAEEALKASTAPDAFVKAAKDKKYKTGKTEFFNLTKGMIPGLNAGIKDYEDVVMLQVGAPVYGKVIKGGGKAYVVKLNSAKEPDMAKLGEKKAGIRTRLENQKKDDVYKKWVADAKAKAKIVIDEEARY